ncbi:cysteine desulfurase NifS [candidate division KSB3 bacterium]|uniref:Cysteine desulfurase n=1 Tax=candidate division KSB3 bacterium TaxID=2044937 RepID=A0A2G6E5P0_9BACT|nr:MAG: cysteine desulfurase NifS [candidate division KSB3 bacterium]PIE29894.1 MAG: cysteine desulfurase NifS [candidate division KSB3 bacterium]
MVERMVYVDNNATTKVDERVVEEMLPFLNEHYGNPSSMHVFGGAVKKNLSTAREQIATLLGADPTEIIFTSCGTESDNMALHSALMSAPEKRHLITTKVEHPAILNYCKQLSKRGYGVTLLPVDRYGMIDLNELYDSLQEDTAIVSIMYANNETGTIFPIEKIGRMVQENGSVFHTDAVQVAGKIPLDMQALDSIDMLSISGHKFHAPKGIGVLYVRRGTKFRPLLIGGHQERGRRPGTENSASIIAMGKAAVLAQEALNDELTRVRAMRDRLERELLAAISDSAVNGHPTERTPNTLNISFKYVEGEAILLMLSEKGIAASSGSACTSGSLEPSHVLRAMGVPFTFSHGSVRLSLSRFNTDEDIDYILQELPPIIERLRQISPFGRNKEEPQ